MNRKKIHAILLVIFLASLPLFILISGSVVYIKSFNGKSMASSANIPMASERATNIVDYIDGKAELDAEGMTGKEVQHLNDVRKLIFRLKLLMMLLLTIASVSFVGLLKISYHSVSHAVIVAGIFTFGFIVVFGSMMLFFESAFARFHEMFFLPDTYLFSADTVIIQLFPENFFFFAFAKILGIILAADLLIVIGAFFWKQRASSHSL